MNALSKLYKKVTCLHADFNALHTFNMWLNEYFPDTWHHNCETRMKIITKFKCFSSLCATKVNNNVEITSVRSFLDLGNKFELENHLSS